MHFNKLDVESNRCEFDDEFAFVTFSLLHYKIAKYNNLQHYKDSSSTWYDPT
jgi:hypothetical protein